MASIYIHIPFCKSRCIYCDFFSTTSLSERQAYLEALKKELEERKNYLGDETIDTIYLGGGTPSQLDVSQISALLSDIYNIYNVESGAEITLEGNPDDLTHEYLTALRAVGVNRLSMGVQTFDDNRLAFLNRRHTAAQAVAVIRDASQVGFGNISIDLMFGFPGQTLNEWKCDVDKALSLPIQHLSAYSLMYEDGTRLARMLDEGKIEEIGEEESLAMYEYLIDATASAGMRHYEISNFAMPGYESRHNSCYWHGVKYLGVGAGAHSYDGASREFNRPSLREYIEGMQAGKCVSEKERLGESERYDEFVFTGLRTSEGISLEKLAEEFGDEKLEFCLENAKNNIESGLLAQTTTSNGTYLKLTRKGLFIANAVISDLMCGDDE